MAETKPGIFRKDALEKLSSPEQLDQLMRITTPKGWLVLLALGILIVAAVVWGVFGSIPTKVAGQGIILRQNSLVEVMTGSAGQVLELPVELGQQVTRGQVLATLKPPELPTQIATAREKLVELQTTQGHLQALGAEGNRARDGYRAMMKQFYEESIAAARNRQTWLREKVGIQEQLLTRGLITRQTLMQTRDQLDETGKSIDQLQTQIDELAVQQVDQRRQTVQELSGNQSALADARRQLEQLEKKFNEAATITAPIAGRVIEVMVRPGDRLEYGRPLLTIESTENRDAPLEAVLFFPIADGKKIATGMVAEVSPVTSTREQDGYLLGSVVAVADYPATTPAIEHLLRNDQLARQFAASPALRVVASLQPDPAATSGYRWSTGGGPELPVTTGTSCAAVVVVRRERPIALVIPALKKFFGMD